MRVSAPGTLVGDPWGFFKKRTSGPMLAVAAVSKWASVGIAKVDVAADVDVAACGLAVVVPLLSCILEAPRAVVEVLEADGVGLFLLDSRGFAALLV